MRTAFNSPNVQILLDFAVASSYSVPDCVPRVSTGVMSFVVARKKMFPVVVCEYEFRHFHPEDMNGGARAAPYRSTRFRVTVDFSDARKCVWPTSSGVVVLGPQAFQLTDTGHALEWHLVLRNLLPGRH